ncbi:MAG: COG4223 family protein [Parvibaculales bacterium]
MAGKRKKPEPEILTPENNKPKQGRQKRDATQDATQSGAPIIDMGGSKKSSFGAGLFWGVLGGLIGSIGILVFLYAAHMVNMPLSSPFIPHHQEKLSEIEARLSTAENNQQRVEAALDVFADMDTRLGDVKAQFAENKAVTENNERTQMAQIQQNMIALQRVQKQVELLKTAKNISPPPPLDDAATPLIWQSILLAQLGHAVILGQPYALELSALQQNLPPKEAAALNILSPYADNGLPPLNALIVEYQTRLPILLSKWRQQQAQGFWGTTKAMLKNFISIRPVGDATDSGVGDDVEQILWRIDDQLTQIQNGGIRLEGLEKTQSLLTRLPENVQTDLSDWREKIKARMAAETLLMSLSGRISAAQNRGP